MHESAPSTPATHRRETRHTWVDLKTDRYTRNPDTRDAWREHGRDLVPTTEPCSVDPVFPNTNIFVGAIRPWWLNSLDGTLSYSELVLRLTDRRL